MRIVTIAEALSRYSPGEEIKILTDGGVYAVTDILVSAGGTVYILGEKDAR